MTQFATDLTWERMLHFPKLRKSTSPPKVTAEMTGLVAELKDKFASRLENLLLPTEVMQLTKDRFSVTGEETLSIKAVCDPDCLPFVFVRGLKQESSPLPSVTMSNNELPRVTMLHAPSKSLQ